MKDFSHSHWVKDIGRYIGDTNPQNIIKFALSYTLQFLRSGEDINHFKWDDIK